MLTNNGTQAIETDRLTLRRFQLSDADAMFKNWANDSEVTKFLTWNPHGNVEMTVQIVQKWVDRYENDNCYNWVIELKELGEAIGGIEVVELNEKYNSCEIGYCMSKEYWGIGIMTEALGAVINYLFDVVGMNRIVAKHDTKNPASGKVMIKNGMQLEGVMRQVKINKYGEYYDLAQYAILKDDWNKRLGRV